MCRMDGGIFPSAKGRSIGEENRTGWTQLPTKGHTRKNINKFRGQKRRIEKGIFELKKEVDAEKAVTAEKQTQIRKEIERLEGRERDFEDMIKKMVCGRGRMRVVSRQSISRFLVFQ